MRTGAEIAVDMRRLQQEMCEFLLENRAANVREGLKPVGPAAIEIGKIVDSFKDGYRQIVHPGEGHAGPDG